MATTDAVDEAILNKMIELVDGLTATTASHHQATANLALAVNHLAEARAWLGGTNQAHGGTANPSESR